MTAAPSAFLERLAALQAQKSRGMVVYHADVCSWEREIARGPSAATGCGDDEFEFVLVDGSATSAGILKIRESHHDIGCRVWDGGVFLARQLMWLTRERRLDLFGKTVVELGSGTGIAGLVCAYLNAKLVVMTDLPRVVPNLAKILDSNRSVPIPSTGDTIGDRCVVTVLEWGVTSLASVLAALPVEHPVTVDVVIASDLAAPVKFVSPLLETLSQLFHHNPDLQFILATQTHREFTAPLLSACSIHYCVRMYEDRDLNARYTSPEGRQALYSITAKPALPGCEP